MQAFYINNCRNEFNFLLREVARYLTFHIIILVINYLRHF